MDLTLSLTEVEYEALKARSEAEGISVSDAAHRAIREFVERGVHRDRGGRAASLIMELHGDALRRLGE